MTQNHIVEAFQRAALAGDWAGVVEALCLESYPQPHFFNIWSVDPGMSKLSLGNLRVGERRETLLHWAAGHAGVPVDIVRLLVTKAFQSSSFLMDSYQHTALHRAILSGREEVVAMMAEVGFVDHVVDEGLGGHPLHLAAKVGNLAILKRIFWVDNAPMPSLQMPLWRAVVAGHVEITRFLLEQGADPIYCANFWRARVGDDGTVSEGAQGCFELIHVSRVCLHTTRSLFAACLNFYLFLLNCLHRR